MRLRSVHPGVDVGDVVAATGFPLVIPDEVPVTRLPTAEELELIRDPARPRRRARAGGTVTTRTTDPHAADRTARASATPIVQTGMGYVSGPRLAAATSNAGGLGLIASATMSLAELEDAITETAGRTSAPFGVNLRADAPDAAERVEAHHRRRRARSPRSRWPRSRS